MKEFTAIAKLLAPPCLGKSQVSPIPSFSLLKGKICGKRYSFFIGMTVTNPFEEKTTCYIVQLFFHLLVTFKLSYNILFLFQAMPCSTRQTTLKRRGSGRSRASTVTSCRPHSGTWCRTQSTISRFRPRIQKVTGHSHLRWSTRPCQVRESIHALVQILTSFI